MTARQLDAFLKRKGSPLAGHGADFIQAGSRFGVSPGLLVAIAGAESSFGQSMSGDFNPFGWGPGINFGSFKEAISTVARGLKNGYLSKGLTTPAQIGAKYAPSHAANDPTGLNSNWVKNVKSYLGQLGGGGVGTAPTGGLFAAPTEAPTLDPSVTQSLSDLGSGKPYDPLKQLSELALNKTAQAASPEPVAPDGSPEPDGGTQEISPAGGAWGGSKRVDYQITRGLGLKSVSEKRDRQTTSSGGVSDHWTGSKTAYARDLSGTVAQMNRAAMILSKRLGLGWNGKGPLISTITRNGFRIQVLWNTPLYGGHEDHIHVGVRKL